MNSLLYWFIWLSIFVIILSHGMKNKNKIKNCKKNHKNQRLMPDPSLEVPTYNNSMSENEEENLLNLIPIKNILQEEKFSSLSTSEEEHFMNTPIKNNNLKSVDALDTMSPKKTNTYSLQQLKNNFIGLRNNPNKFVKFELNAENMDDPNAGGLYELLPYYVKVNPFEEEPNYAIHWCQFRKQWEILKLGPLGLFPAWNMKQTTIATLLEGEQFARKTPATIKSYKTYETLKSNMKEVGKQNRELKNTAALLEDKVTLLQEEISKLQIENENFQTSKTYESLTQNNQELHEKVLSLEAENLKLKTENQKFKNIAKTKINEKEKENQELKEKLKKMEDNYKQIQDASLEESKIQEEKSKEQQTKIYKLKSDNEHLQYLLSIAENERKKVPSLQKENLSIKALLKTQNDKMDIQNKVIDQQHQKIRLTIEKVETLTRSQSAILEVVEKKTKYISKVEETLKERNEVIAEMEVHALEAAKTVNNIWQKARKEELDDTIREIKKKKSSRKREFSNHETRKKFKFDSDDEDEDNQKNK